MNAGVQHDTVDAVILAAGKGTRMKSDLAKVLHRLAGEPLLTHIVATVRAAHIDRTVVVIGHQADLVRAICVAPDLVFVVQEPQLGTGHAVQVAAPELREGGYTVVTAGDVPLLTVATLRRLIDTTIAERVAATVLTCVVEDAGIDFVEGRYLASAELVQHFRIYLDVEDGKLPQPASHRFSKGGLGGRFVDRDMRLVAVFPLFLLVLGPVFG